MDHDMEATMDIPGATGHSETIAIVIYPNFTLLDAIGPHHVFASLLGAQVLFVAESSEPVMTDTGVVITPNVTFDACPQELTVLCVPGGTAGTLVAMEAPALQDFLRERGEQTEWITSVCTGSLVLGAAGLLRGYRATSHWVVRELLAELGATPVVERVVRDRNRMTGGGVTAGIDMALTLAMTLRGRPYAELVQLISEYAPAPPLDAGTPERAGEATVASATSLFQGFVARARDTAQRVRGSWG